MQTLNSRVLQVVVLMLMTVALTLSAEAASFSKASLKGGYSFLFNKWTADVNSNQDANVGIMTFDGAGNVTGSSTEILGGVVQTNTFSGTYTVNSNGTGAINFPTLQYPQIFITLASSASGLAHGVQLLDNKNANNVESGTALLQSTTAATYGLASVKGNFSFQLNEWTSDVNIMSYGAVGTLSFDGKGKVKGSFTDVLGGVPQTGTFTGTYTVNSDGSGSMSLAGGGNPQLAFALNSTAAGIAKGLQLMQTNSTGNIVISGIALKQ
jgi:hypothetical protein